MRETLKIRVLIDRKVRETSKKCFRDGKARAKLLLLWLNEYHGWKK